MEKSIYELMNEIDDNECLNEEESINELFGMGKKKYEIQLMKNIAGVDPHKFGEEIRRILSANGIKLPSAYMQDDDSKMYRIHFECSEKVFDKCWDAIEKIPYEDVCDTKRDLRKISDRNEQQLKAVVKSARSYKEL